MKIKEYKNIIWNTVGTIINSFASLIYLIVVTRINGIDTSGIFSFCFSFSLVLYTAANLGGRIFEISDKNQFDDNYYLTLKIFTCIVSIFAALAFGIVMKYGAMKIFLILIFMLVRSVEAFSDTFYAIFQKNDRLDYVGFSYFLKNIFSFVIFLIIDLITENVILSTVALLLTTIIVYLFYDYRHTLRFRKIKISFDYKKIYSLFKNILPFMLFNLLTMVIANIPRIIVDLYYTDVELGYFGILIMIPTVIILLGQLIIQPYINQLTDDFYAKQYKKITVSVKKIMILISSVSLLCAIGAFVLGPWAIQLLYNVSFENYRASIVVLVISGMFNCYASMISTVLTVIRKTRIQLGIYSFVVIFEIICMSILLKILPFSIVFWTYLGIMILQFFIFAICYHILFVRRYAYAKD